MSGKESGTVYLLHFSQPYRHAQHYIGWTSDLTGRLAQHASGNGARLVEVITSHGIAWECVRTWDGDRALERQLKRRRDARILCPVCAAERRARKRLYDRTRRRKKEATR
jgi:predicted GIY-YIG superfamily endonuclease